MRLLPAILIFPRTASLLLAATLLTLAACSRQNSSPPAEAPKSAPAAAPAATSALSAPLPPPTEFRLPPPPPHEPLDADRVESLTTAFLWHLDLLTAHNGAPNTDLLPAEALQPLSSADALSLADALLPCRPFASMQIWSHILSNESDPLLRAQALTPFARNLMRFGSEEDRDLIQQTHLDLLAWVADSTQASLASASTRQTVIHALADDIRSLGGGVDDWALLADTLRRTARTNLERSLADWYDTTRLLYAGQTDGLRPLFEAIRSRGVYTSAFMTEAAVNKYLTRSPAELAALTAVIAASGERSRANAETYWRQQISRTPTERIADIYRPPR